MAHVLGGHAKPPQFGSVPYDPIQTLPFPDLSPVVAAFRVDRDLGVDAHFTPRDLPFEGWVRVGNGTGSPLGNDNALPAGYGALDLVLGRAWVARSRPSAPPAPLGLRLGGSVLVEKVRDRNGVVGVTPLGFTYFRPIVVSGARVVGEGHAIGYAGPARLTVEGAIADEGRSRDDDGNPATPRLPLPSLRSYGLTAELAWTLLGTPRTVGRAPRPAPLAPRRRGRGRPFGPLEIAARYDGLWLGRGAADVRAGGSQGGALAVKWWPEDYLAVTLSAYATRYDVSPIEAPTATWSVGGLARLSVFFGAANEPHAAER